MVSRATRQTAPLLPKQASRETEALAEELRLQARQAQLLPWAGASRSIRGLTAAVGNNVVRHGLGQVPRGWFPTDTTAALALFRAAWDAETITLTSAAIGGYDLFIW